MPELKNPDLEAFAQGRARGLDVPGAYVAAGYKRSRGAGARVGGSPRVERRLAELMAERQALRQARIEETIAALVAMADGADLKSGAGIKEARAARIEAHRLSELLTNQRTAAAWEPPREMTEAEWDAKYGPDAPGSGC